MENWIGKDLYYGNLLTNERQFKQGNFIGLALYPTGSKDILHNAYDPLPVSENSINKVQSQDVFEHLEFDKIPAILDEIFRVLKYGGVFRLSLPDYRSPLLRSRSVYDENGTILADLMMGGSVTFEQSTTRRVVSMRKGGHSHIWFPNFENVLELITLSDIRKASQIIFYHYFRADGTYVCKEIPENEMFVIRAPPHDSRAGGAPVSIVVDFVK